MSHLSNELVRELEMSDGFGWTPEIAAAAAKAAAEAEKVLGQEKPAAAGGEGGSGPHYHNKRPLGFVEKLDAL